MATDKTRIMGKKEDFAEVLTVFVSVSTLWKI